MTTVSLTGSRKVAKKRIMTTHLAVQKALTSSWLLSVAIVRNKNLPGHFVDVADVDSFSGRAVDVWSLGVTLYCMTFNQLPFWDDSEYNLFQKIHKEEYSYSFIILSL